MLATVLKILSVIGILLLILLGIVLTVLLLVLFCPITYKVRGERHPLPEREDSDGMAAKIVVKANWLFGLLRVRAYYPDPGSVTVKVLFFKIYDSAKEEQDKEKPKPKKKTKQKRKRKDKDEGEPKQRAGADAEPESGPRQGGPVEAETEEPFAKPRDVLPDPECETGTEDEAPEQTQKPSSEGKKRFRVSQIGDKIKNFREKTDFYREMLHDADARGLLNHVFTRLGKILKSIRPRKLEARILFGTGSPDTTGYLLGIYGMMSPYLGRHVDVTPDFERAVLEGDLYAAGHITVWKILWNVLRIVLDKRLRGLLKKIKSKG